MTIGAGRYLMGDNWCWHLMTGWWVMILEVNLCWCLDACWFDDACIHSGCLLVCNKDLWSNLLGVLGHYYLANGLSFCTANLNAGGCLRVLKMYKAQPFGSFSWPNLSCRTDISCTECNCPKKILWEWCVSDVHGYLVSQVLGRDKFRMISHKSQTRAKDSTDHITHCQKRCSAAWLSALKKDQSIIWVGDIDLCDTLMILWDFSWEVCEIELIGPICFFLGTPSFPNLTLINNIPKDRYDKDIFRV